MGFLMFRVRSMQIGYQQCPPLIVAVGASLTAANTRQEMGEELATRGIIGGYVYLSDLHLWV